ncbi:MAG TPA: M20/M25/M40 family metallo-hydrolase [Spirochaetia bacterium]|nr:M20/M25/M40 family metallo-hydrolase [Spirochaetia bacterium]
MPPGSQKSSELFDLLARLVSIDSINCDLVPGSPGEGEIAAAVASWARERGLEVHVEETGLAGRPNVIVVARGKGGGRSLMLNAHMDTVGVAGMENPFRPSVRDGRLYGRGAMDTKAALAAFMTAAERARDLSLAGDVILTAVVDEEYASAGTEAVLKKWKADAAMVGEPTGLQIVTAHKGFAWFEVETRGVAAHGSRPEAGVDAIAKMGRVLVALERKGAGLAAGRHHPILGPGSVHASLISGGQELSSYPAACRLSIERRTLPGENMEALEQELRDELAAMARADPSFMADVRTVFTRQPMEVSRSLPAVQALARCVARVTGAEAMFSGMGAWMDSSLITAAGIPAVILGPRGDGLHGASEWVELDSVQACADIAVEMAREFCR